ncbi:MAG: hypothetical protein KDB05_31705, partial [Planctomycetales bacterium]|nr:hypothetical protein [Planctomycetales bacterium]
MIAAGLVGAGGANSHSTSSPKTYAYLGDSAEISAPHGDISLLANSTADAQATGRGFAAGFAAVNVINPKATVNPTVRAYTAGGGSLIGKNVAINSESTATGNAVTGGVTVGAVSLGSMQPEVHITNTNEASVGEKNTVRADGTVVKNSDGTAHVVDGTVQLAGGAVEISATSHNSGTPSARSIDGGIVDLSSATVTFNVVDHTKTEVKSGATITADKSVTVTSSTDTTAHPKATIYSFGAAVKPSTNVAMNITNDTQTSISGKLTSPQITVTATVPKLDVTAETDSDAIAAVDDADATTKLTTNSTAVVNVEPNAVLDGHDGVTLTASHELLKTVARAKANSHALLGKTTAKATNDLTTTTTVNAQQGSQISTRDLTVEALSPKAPQFEAEAHEKGALIDIGNDKNERTLHALRMIDFNSHVVVPPPTSPLLVIDENGDVVKQVNVKFDRTDDAIVVHDIDNSGPLSGKITFSIPMSDHDGSTDANISSSATLKGDGAEFDFDRAYKAVTLTNHSSKDLRVNKLNVLNPSTHFDLPITYVPSSLEKKFTQDKFGQFASKTELEISSTSSAGGDVILAGDINNPLGTSTIKSSADSIKVANSNVAITTSALTMEAAQTIDPASAEGRIQIGG